MTLLGTVAALNRYPVKAMMGEALNSVVVTPDGFAGDRAYALIDGDGRICTGKIQRKWRAVFQSRARYLAEPNGAGPAPAEITLPDGARTSTDAADIADRFADLVGFPVELITERRPDLKLESPPLGQVPESEDDPTMDFPVVNGFFDLGAMHLLTTATLDTLQAEYPQGRFDPRRFRPNVIVETPPGTTGFPENDWPGHIIGIGDEVQIRVMMPTIRCVVTTQPQDDLPRDPMILKTAARLNHANVGVYAMIVQGGPIRRGDEMRILE